MTARSPRRRAPPRSSLMAVLLPVPVVPMILKCLVSSPGGTGMPASVSPSLRSRAPPGERAGSGGAASACVTAMTFAPRCSTGPRARDLASAWPVAYPRPPKHTAPSTAPAPCSAGPNKARLSPVTIVSGAAIIGECSIWSSPVRARIIATSIGPWTLTYARPRPNPPCSISALNRGIPDRAA